MENNLIPDSLIDVFYEKIKNNKNVGISYEHYLENIKKLNGHIPYKIKQLLDSNNDINVTIIGRKIYDDTSSGDDFTITKILYQDNTIILAEVSNEWYEDNLKVIIDKETKEVSHNELNFYLADI